LNIIVTLNVSQRSLKVIENGTIWKLGYGFLFAFHIYGWIRPLISKSHAVFELVPVTTKQLALYSETGHAHALFWDLFCSIQKIEMFIDAAKRGFYRVANWTNCV